MTTEFFTGPVAIILYMYIGLWIWETAFPAKQLPYIKYWKLKGVLFFIFNFSLSTFFPLLVDAYLAPYQLYNLERLPVILQVGIGVFIYQAILYFWHRAMHRSDILWKAFHQMHHSAERLDVPSAFYTSPMDTIGFTMIGSISFVLIVGLTAEAATISLLILTFFAIFQHANIKTPRWIGYLVQRPESHSMHHGRGLHKYNYSDLPVIDMIFGTFRNPENFAKETGFYDGASQRIGDMLIFKDVSRPGE
jgi:sterol desaturase/sphingolipid hydroxylase (fatty acid hydroxylase superfamily)